MKLLFMLTLCMLLSGCTSTDKKMKNSEWVDARIVGSYESPDPVLKRVEQLQRQGLVKNVIVMESFPVQIHLQASQKTIDELNRIPRVKGNLQ